MPAPETQFSIYKISYTTVDDFFNTHRDEDLCEYQDKVSLALINSIAAIVKKKGGELHKIKCRGIFGVIFKTTHNPAWKAAAQHLMSNNELHESNISDSFLTNTNVSYVILCRSGENLYACTGGYGSNYNSKFVVKNFGLYLLPKLIGRDNQVLKSVIQNNLIGDQSSTNKVNRNTTSFLAEQDMSSIFRQLTVEASKSVAEDIGVSFSDEEPDNKKISITNKDSLVIRRSFSFSELITILDNITEIEKKEDAFVLNYMVLARKKGLKNADLYEKMVEDFSLGEFSRFVLVGDDYELYYSNATKYRITADNTDELLIEKDMPITVDDIIPLITSEEGRITKSSVRTMLKHWFISTEDNSGAIVLFPIKLFDAMQGFIEFGAKKTPCYLFNGTWFVFDEHYDTLLSKEYNDFFDNNKFIADDIMGRWNLSHKEKNEDNYNEWLAQRDDVMVSHKVLLDNVEIADAIFWENETVYFMHNKAKFSGEGARDLTNQILAAAEYFQIHRMAFDAQAFYRRYYQEIKKKSQTYKRQLNINEEEFVSILAGAKNYCFLAGYLSDYKKDSRSTYAKYLSIELKKKLNAKGFTCYILGIT